MKRKEQHYPSEGGNHHRDHEQLCEIICLMKQLINQGEIMAKTFADLQASVTKLTDASAAILAVLNGVVDKLKACSTVTDFQGVTDQLDASAQALTDAAVANTDAAPPAA